MVGCIRVDIYQHHLKISTYNQLKYSTIMNINNYSAHNHEITWALFEYVIETSTCEISYKLRKIEKRPWERER